MKKNEQEVEMLKKRWIERAARVQVQNQFYFICCQMREKRNNHIYSFVKWMCVLAK